MIQVQTKLLKSTLSRLTQFMANESPLKRMENAFYFLFFGHVEKGLDKKDKVDFKIYDVTNWMTKNYDARIAIYLKK